MTLKRTTLKRKKPLRANPDATKAWKERSRKELPKRSTKRRSQEVTYRKTREEFLWEHPICPVTGQPATEIHHSARRSGGWLNIQRYWIAVSAAGHRWIEDNAEEAVQYGLMVRIRGDTCRDHIEGLQNLGVDINEPLFYKEEHYYRLGLERLRKKLKELKYF